MEIKGTFKNVNNETIQVRIWSLEGTFTYDIDTAKDKAIYFDADPVEIETNCDDAFTEIIIKDCNINLITKMYLGDYLFSTRLTDIKVEVKNITRGNYIFCGFVEPEIYSQGYAYHYETLSIHCLDSLGILQYIPYTHTHTSTDYDLYKSNMGIIPFRDVLEHIFEDTNVFIEDGVAKPIQWLYVGSNNANTMNINNDLLQTSINEQIFVGEEESDCMTKEEALSEILKYFNLHAVQEGEYIYLFNRDILKYDGTVKTYSYSDLGGSGNSSGLVRHITLSTSDYASDDTTISTDDVYNQIQVKCEREVMDDFIESPLEADYMTAPFYNKQYYCRLLYNTGDEEQVEHWFLRYKESLNWDFKNNFTYDKQNPINQWSILSSLKTYDYSAALVSFGDIETTRKAGDYSIYYYEVKQIPSMTDYLVISVNGNDNVNSLKSLVKGEDINSMVDSDGIVKYKLNTNGVYSPTSSSVKNYIVFSGDVLYQGLRTSSSISDEYNKKYNSYRLGFVHNVKDSGIMHPALVNPDTTSCIMPPTTTGNVEYMKFTKMNFDDGNGNIVTVDKIPILQCVLKIGDKYLSEQFVPKYDMSFDENEEYFDVDINKISHKWTTTPSTFALYIQPEVDSSIIGKKHSMINEVSANMQIDVQGQAIPIEFEDNLSGKIEFKILGPYSIDCKWQEKKRNGWWKRMWGDETDTITKEDSLLGNTEAIFIDNFEVKFVTDNGKINLLKDADLIYYSAENNRYINKKDDIEFKINSGMTFEQSQQMNIMNLPSISNPIMDNNVMTTFLNGVKPEHAYIDFYYNEYSTPKIKLDTTIRNFSNLMDDGDLSTSTALTPHLKTWTVGNYFKDKTFYTLSASYDVKNNTSNLSLKEL